jgi:hypothetical protein
VLFFYRLTAVDTGSGVKTVTADHKESPGILQLMDQLENIADKLLSE